ncbi:MAG: hypothetical protein Ct9H300mP28_33110 [Pseudomonadota bacterium]|nr:MAG: hypothetical protein Ct9H300mP28_33110 [Pseudomonadota bacterium]
MYFINLMLIQIKTNLFNEFSLQFYKGTICLGAEKHQLQFFKAYWDERLILSVHRSEYRKLVTDLRKHKITYKTMPANFLFNISP